MVRHDAVHSPIINCSRRGRRRATVILEFNGRLRISDRLGTVFEMNLDGWKGAWRSGSDPIGRSIYNLLPGFLLVTLARRLGAFPATKRADFGFCQAQFIECPEKPAMPGESTQAHAMGAIGVIQPGVLSLDTIQRPVKRGGFYANFWNQMTSDMSGE